MVNEIITKILVMHRESLKILTNNISTLNEICIKQNEALRLLNNKIQELENEIKELKQ